MATKYNANGTKHAPCNGVYCGGPGNSCHERGRDDNDRPVWVCNNCGTETPRRVPFTKKDAELKALFDSLLAS